MKKGTLSEMKAFIDGASKAELKEFIAECQTSCTCDVNLLVNAQYRLSTMSA